eukprot:8966861-Alexandrium_andersonii.AAC.1
MPHGGRPDEHARMLGWPRRAARVAQHGTARALSSLPACRSLSRWCMTCLVTPTPHLVLHQA